MSTGGGRPIAAFDFDGTLARGDSLLPFLLELIGGERLARTILRHAPALGLIAVGRGQRDLTKERFIAHALAGHAAEEIHARGREFAEEYVRNRLIPATAERVTWHRSHGHELVLVSASLDVYLEPIRKILGFDHLLCTRLEIEDGRATGRLVGANVRGTEKARLLLGHISRAGDDHRETWAYGNSSGDHALLDMADHPHWVSRRGRVTPYADRANRSRTTSRKAS